jgi:heavy metal sensor kinase
MALALLVSLVVCATLYAGTYLSLHQEVDGFLEGEVAEFRAILSAHDGDAAAVEQQIRREIGSRTRGDLFFRLLDASGHVLASSSPEDALGTPWPVAQVGSTMDDPACFSTVAPQGAAHAVRACSLWVADPAAGRRIVQVGYRLDRVDKSLHSFLRACGIALIVATALAAAGATALARSSLRPIQRITSTARRIHASSLGERIALTGSGDELDGLAATLNEMFARIETQVRQMQQFAADASHELRTPLAALRGIAEVTLTQPRTPEQLRAVIEESIEHYDRLARIAEDLLLLARSDAGEDILRRETLRLDAAIADVMDLYEPLAGERGVTLRFDGCGPVTVEGDAGRLRQLIGNLVDNAIKYTAPAGTVQVSLELFKDMARIRVTDTGVGIPPADVPRVFDRFYRVGRTGAAVQPAGTGLGLAICRTITRAHGGEITLHSTAGEGTSVQVTLPARWAHAERIDAGGPPAPPRSSRPAQPAERP